VVVDELDDQSGMSELSGGGKSGSSESVAIVVYVVEISLTV
jgi:hypothetical protein